MEKIVDYMLVEGNVFHGKINKTSELETKVCKYLKDGWQLWG